MIYWIYGNSGAGKTTFSEKFNNCIFLDGDEMRNTISKDLGYSEKDRLENNLRIARLAKHLNEQGFDVVVSTICPTKKIREQVYWITKCRFIKIEGEFKYK